MSATGIQFTAKMNPYLKPNIYNRYSQEVQSLKPLMFYQHMPWKVAAFKVGAIQIFLTNLNFPLFQKSPFSKNH